jgi:hypothetical protein
MLIAKYMARKNHERRKKKRQINAIVYKSSLHKGRYPGKG